MERIRSIAQWILDGRLSPEFGARAIWELAADEPSLNPNHELDDFIFAAAEWDDVRWSAVIPRRAKRSSIRRRTGARRRHRFEE